MTNDNEQPEASNELPAGTVYGPEPAPAAPVPPPVAAVEQTPAPAPVAAAPVAAAPVAERTRWRASRGVMTIAGAAVGGVLLFGSGVAVGHAVDRHDDHRPGFMREIGTRGAQNGQNLQPRNDQTQPGTGRQLLPRNGGQTPPRDGGQVQPRNGNQTQPRNGGQATPQSDSGRS